MQNQHLNPQNADAKPCAPEDTDGARDEVERLFLRYERYLGSIALRLLGRPEDVDDVIQDVFIDAYRGYHKLNNKDVVKQWLTTITIRKVRRRLRMRRMRSFIGLDQYQEYHELSDASASPEDRVALVELLTKLDTLPANERIAWVLRHVEGESMPAIARHLDCSLSTAKRRVDAAQQHLQELLP